MEVHNALSAKIVELSGFKIIWASGLTISASIGLRDCSEITYSEMINTVKYITDFVDIPVIVDADTGYGDYNTFIRVVKQSQKANISALCIEDKVFPKSNSFLNLPQNLATTDDFCSKIKAGKDHSDNRKFSIIARLEGLVLGDSLENTLERANRYYEAGADAILIHSKKTDAEEILRFAKLWANKCPVLVIPTKYYNVTANELRENKISIAIWANHNLRASIKAMQRISARIFKDQGIFSTENQIASIESIFDLTGIENLQHFNSIQKT